MPDYSDRICEILADVVEIIDESDFSSVIPRLRCEGIFARYILTLHQRMFTFMIMKIGMRTHVVSAAIAIVSAYIHIRFGMSYRDLSECDREGVLGSFTLYFVSRIINATRMRLQIVLESEFISNLDP